jgi:glyoxylase-like metal-dependent hydrolase (beta-lactamase superfamily II)
VSRHINLHNAPKETSAGESPSPQLPNHAHAHCPTLVSHVLLLETDAGLVLVDTGFGLEDIAGLARRLGWFRHVIRPVFSAEETPARQAGRLGFTQDDVRHIIITHFDMDHIGALADFPRAAVHATAAGGAGRHAAWVLAGEAAVPVPPAGARSKDRRT